MSSNVLIFAVGAAWGLVVALLRSSDQIELVILAKKAFDANDGNIDTSQKWLCEKGIGVRRSHLIRIQKRLLRDSS